MVRGSTAIRSDCSQRLRPRRLRPWLQQDGSRAKTAPRKTAASKTVARPRRPGPAIPQPVIKPPDEYAAAWAAPKPDSDTWTPRPWVTVADRAAYGKTARQASPRRSHAAFEPAAGRDPVAIILAQEADRLQDLLPLRHGRMAASSFAFYRGAPAVMAFDLSTTPVSQITVQASGDAHLSNFGLFASPERTLVFDSNDFDETLPGPWEWDVKRLAASVVIASRANGFTPAAARASVLATVAAYREQMARLFRDAAARHLVRPDDRRPDRARARSRLGKASDSRFTAKDAQGQACRPSSPRPAARTR